MHFAPRTSAVDAAEARREAHCPDRARGCRCLGVRDLLNRQSRSQSGEVSGDARHSADDGRRRRLRVAGHHHATGMRVGCVQHCRAGFRGSRRRRGKGLATVSFRVAANDGASTRDGMIVVNGEQARVSQRAPCRYDVGPASQNVSASGGAGSINIATTSDCSWSAASEASWIALTSSPSGTGNGTVNFTVAPNPGDARSGAIVIGAISEPISRKPASRAPPPPPPAAPRTSRPRVRTLRRLVEQAP